MDICVLQVACVICGVCHTTLTNSYISHHEATGHMHVKDLGEGEFVCEWCRHRVCTACGGYSSVGSYLARPGLWLTAERFVCTACNEAGRLPGRGVNFNAHLRVRSSPKPLLLVYRLLSNPHHIPQHTNRVAVLLFCMLTNFLDSSSMVRGKYTYWVLERLLWGQSLDHDRFL